MCGIAGILSKDPSIISDARIKKMTDSLAHRGPDGEGIWINDTTNIALGHRRLAIIDLTEGGKQPMNYLDRYVIIHNGEVYNYIELKEELEKYNYIFHTKTDTEVIAAAFDKWGEDCIDNFDGMFSFAIWDKKKQELFAARDRFGEKPFFYFFDDKQFVFASEMKALWSAGVERKANLKLLFNFLTIGYVDNPNIPEETFFEKIYKLPAASYLKISINNLQPLIEPYWDIDLEYQRKSITDTEAIETFGTLLEKSVKRRLRSDVTIGTSLSGGLDSSSVIATLHSLNDPMAPMNAFTAVFPGFERDETTFANQVAEKFGLSHYTTHPDSESLLKEFDKVSYHQEEPFSSASAFSQFKVYELAAEKDVKVLLDGQGADEVLAGYHKYYKWYWQELFLKRKLSSSHELQAARKLGIKEKFGWRNIVASLFPEFATIFLERRYLLNALRHEDLTRDFIRLQSKEAYYSTPEIFSLNGILYFNTCMHGLEELLRYADRNSMAFGREIRLPFLNHELVEFIFSLPSEFKIREGWTKWLLRKSVENRLRNEIVWRKDKTGFEPPQLYWMMNKRIQEMIFESKALLVKENILNKETLTKKIEPKAAHEAGNYDWRYLTAACLFK